MAGGVSGGITYLLGELLFMFITSRAAFYCDIFEEMVDVDLN